MGNHWQTGKQSWYLTTDTGKLSLAIPMWVSTISTSESYGTNRHTMQCTSPKSMVLQCKLG